MFTFVRNVYVYVLRVLKTAANPKCVCRAWYHGGVHSSFAFSLSTAAFMQSGDKPRTVVAKQPLWKPRQTNMEGNAEQ